jgi:hypothetical protein
VVLQESREALVRLVNVYVLDIVLVDVLCKVDERECLIFDKIVLCEENDS